MNSVTTPIEQAVDSGLIPGAVVLHGRGDDIRIEAIGLMAVDGPPMPPDALMRIQSMTKVITSAAALLAEQEGRLSLTDPVQHWLPELADRRVLRTPGAALDDTVPAQRPIQVRDLLINGSGYGMATTDVPWAHAMREAGVEAGPEPPALAADEWLARLATLPLAHQPGAGFRYHHSFSILGILLQRAAGRPLNDHLRELLFEPLGMPDTGLWAPREQAHRLPAAYRRTDDAVVEVEPLGGGFYAGPPTLDVAHGELVSTAADFARFARMLADQGRHEGQELIRADLVEQLRSDQVVRGAKTPDSFFPGFWDGTGWGYGVSIQTEGPHRGRYGWAGGQGTDWFSDPDGTITLLLTQMELSAQMFGLLQQVQDAVPTRADG